MSLFEKIATRVGLLFLVVFAPLDPAAAQKAGPAALDPAAQETLGAINARYNSFRTMEGDFIQFAPDGSRSEGSFVISRPGRVRFRYDPPTRLDIIADGKSVAVRDTKNATQDLWPLGKTPLRFLLSDKIDLLKDAKVISVDVQPDEVAVVVSESTVFGTGQLALYFNPQSHDLTRWVVTDAQGQETAVSIYNIETDKPADPKLFTIDYQRLIK